MLWRNFLGSFLVLQSIIGIICRLTCSSFKLFHQLIASQIIYCFLGLFFDLLGWSFFQLSAYSMPKSYLKASILFSCVLVPPRDSLFFIISLFIMLMSLQQHVHVSTKVLRLWFNSRTEGGTHQDQGGHFQI